ncbi:MAG: RNase P modulator RnpM [Anaerolineales bacterium]
MPQRTCVGCRTVQAKRQLVRLVRTADGHVLVDPSGKAAGRGAYLHDRRRCWEAALGNRALDRALRMTLTEADRASLRLHGEQYSDDD